MKCTDEAINIPTINPDDRTPSPISIILAVFHIHFLLIAPHISESQDVGSNIHQLNATMTESKNDATDDPLIYLQFLTWPAFVKGKVT